MNEPGRVPGRFRLAALVVLGVVVVTAPWWGPPALSHLAFFRMRKVELRGVTFISEADLVQRLDLDTTKSIWIDLEPIRKKVAEHPQVHAARVSRKLPGTIVIHVEEKKPVALVATARGFDVVDSSVSAIPVSPSRGNLNLPILHSRDSALVRLLAGVERELPSLYARISEVKRAAKGEIQIVLFSVPVLAMSDVTVDRLADILPVERDLAGKGIRVEALDIRFRGQVIARIK